MFNSTEQDGVGLSDPSLAPGRRAMLDLVNNLHSTGATDLPQIAVIGSQSAGKSSLIESISGITLPRAAGTCTRCPTECRLSRSEGRWQCVVTLRFTVDKSGQALGQARNVTFGDIIYDKTQVEDRIRRAQKAILNPTSKPSHFLKADFDDETNPEGQLTFSSNCVELKISGPDVADLSFCDLPGLIASVGRSGNSGDISLVENLIKSYIKKPSCVILLTVACETDFENQGAHRLAKDFDPQGRRTVGVLTKPDRIPPGEEFQWISFIRNEKEPLEHNWFSVKQPSSSELKQGITWTTARENENNFFSSTAPWSDLDPMYQKYLRTSNLIRRLSDILSDLISKRLPEIHEEIEATLRRTHQALDELPPAPSADPFSDISRLVNAFVQDAHENVKGVPDENGLLQTIRPEQERFRKLIRATAPDFRPYARRSEGKRKYSQAFFEAEDGQDRPDIDPAAVPASEEPSSNVIYVDELPGIVPWEAEEELIQKFTRHWGEPAHRLCDLVYNIISHKISALVSHHFSNFGQGRLEHRVQFLVQGLLKKCLDKARLQITWFVEAEQDPSTLNTHYLSDYRAKEAGEHGDIMERIRNYVPVATASAPGEEAQISGISKILEGFAELGMFGIKPEDFPKLLPADQMTPALEIMADVSAYFHVAYKRFVDNVAKAIDKELVRGIDKEIYSTLMAGLRVSGPEGQRVCSEYAQESSQAAAKREELQNKLNRLTGASEELISLGG
ncbi:P-loop containing nucleoside triphosphate hydrolase protein [Schizophyllum amplum]|uniref:P-loop containing nucleoside triphosphate hydrolase protein n=1 Tax=Schizophyllum amplum TaxID=97359 RepID=A0A550CZ30_9AGAR|nr:P-loop containing nucleoside triphosphate hydrolase protein [Auriculariopsis ampla]